MAPKRVGALALLLLILLLHLAYYTTIVKPARTFSYLAPHTSTQNNKKNTVTKLLSLQDNQGKQVGEGSSFPLIPAPSKQCTHALILSSDNYFTCTAVALFSLLENDPEASVVVFVAESVSKGLSTALADSFPSVAVYDVGVLLNPNPEQEVKSKRMKLNFTKWRIWQIDSETVIYMDSDFLVLKNLEGLCSSNSAISAIHNYDSTLKTYTEDTHNAGFLVIKPSPEKLVKMLNFSSTFLSRKGGDQAAINGFYKGNIKTLDRNVVASNANVWRDAHPSWDIEKITSFHMTRDMNPCASSYRYFEENMSLFLEGKLAHDHPHFLWIRSFLNLKRLHPGLEPFINSTFRL